MRTDELASANQRANELEQRLSRALAANAEAAQRLTSLQHQAEAAAHAQVSDGSLCAGHVSPCGSALLDLHEGCGPRQVMRMNSVCLLSFLTAGTPGWCSMLP